MFAVGDKVSILKNEMKSLLEGNKNEKVAELIREVVGQGYVVISNKHTYNTSIFYGVQGYEGILISGTVLIPYTPIDYNLLDEIEE